MADWINNGRLGVSPAEGVSVNPHMPGQIRRNFDLVKVMFMDVSIPDTILEDSRSFIIECSG